jgi:hypothetical protein
MAMSDEVNRVEVLETMRKRGLSPTEAITQIEASLRGLGFEGPELLRELQKYLDAATAEHDRLTRLANG